MSVHRWYFQGKENWRSGNGTIAFIRKSERPSAILLSWQQEPLWLYFQKIEKKYLPPELPLQRSEAALGRLHHSCAHLHDRQPCIGSELPSLHRLRVYQRCSEYCHHWHLMVSVGFFNLYHGATCLVLYLSPKYQLIGFFASSGYMSYTDLSGLSLTLFFFKSQLLVQFHFLF